VEIEHSVIRRDFPKISIIAKNAKIQRQTAKSIFTPSDLRSFAKALPAKELVGHPAFCSPYRRPFPHQSPVADYL
jgi:hypothetical protein